MKFKGNLALFARLPFFPSIRLTQALRRLQPKGTDGSACLGELIMAKKVNKDTLLVPVDFTSYSEEALIFASNLAEKLETRLLVLHVIHDPAEAPGFYVKKGKKKKFLQSMEEAAEEMMEEFLKKMREANPDRIPLKEAMPLLVVGTPVTRIVEIAEKKRACMIIIGSHGRTGLSHLLVGSKAERVVQLSPIPVTVVKSSKKK
jgi:nucleotide-binding universal stress UspA family protein